MHRSRRASLVAALGSLTLLGTVLTGAPALAHGSSPHPAGHRSDPTCGTANSRLLGTARSAPSNLCVPGAATDSSSTLLVWNKPESADVVDYVVYRDGRPLGRASTNAEQHTPSQEYVDTFYANDADGWHVKVQNHSFKVTGLSPNRGYTFTVRAVLANGRLSAPSNALRVTTTQRAQRIDVTSRPFRAVGDGTTVNTRAIQKAVDSCRSRGCTVVIPKGTFRTGALFLHSNMTLELAQGARLLGSDDWADYPVEKGYYLYAIPTPVPTDASYTAYLRPPSLLNVRPDDLGRSERNRRPGAVAENVRIVGPGVIDGDGWKRTAAGTTTDETGNELPDYVASSAAKVATDGILAANQVEHARAVIDTMPGIVNRPATVDDKSIYGQYRSSLATFIGVDGLYLDGFTVENPAFHGVMVLDSADVGVYGTRNTTFDTNNGDAIEFGGTQRAVVANNFFDSGDDVMNFAAGQGKYGAEGRSSGDVWMFDNYVRRGHGGVAIGSHTAAWVQHLLAEDNVFNRTETGALRMKSTSDMNGGARDVVFRDSAVACMKTSAFIASLSYTLSPSGYVSGSSATFRDIVVRDVSVDGNSTSTCGMASSTSKPVIDIEAGPANDADTVGPFTFDDVRFRNVNPTGIEGLTGSTFRDVCFASVLGDADPWNLDAASTGNVFRNVSPAPGEGGPTSTCR
ncbi:glycoside hydrolase family 28 protein [Luteimicrobium xylanilyticum]|uniref:Exo-poly-alpha-galacturonosidase n=1 Tax=Luteimicrobium xylanilyticum TaxID=1133546 RepID=A0A5P9QEV6_9MICO|nr:glycosyl hydrolase family 28 protein [Luteimicrobium xylanilyticum]QFV00002.1 Exo-poly-alpha-galacturonosidase [Luteimicrobium xylanilyticum]